MDEWKNFELLEEKMTIELKNLHERYTKMNTEITTKFDKINSIKIESE